MSNALEYALVLHPLTPDATGLPVAVPLTLAGENYLACTFRRRTGTADAQFFVETSSDLVNWTANAVLASTVDHQNDTHTETWRCPVPRSVSARQAMRLRVVVGP